MIIPFVKNKNKNYNGWHRNIKVQHGEVTVFLLITEKVEPKIVQSRNIPP